jgi:hypothetical protein
VLKKLKSIPNCSKRCTCVLWSCVVGGTEGAKVLAMHGGYAKWVLSYDM